MKIVAIIASIMLTFGSLQSMAQTATTSTPTAEPTFLNEPQLEIKNSIELFPNPVEDYLQVKIVNSELQDVKFEMHSIIGNVVHIETEETGADSYRIPVESFASGYYFLVVKDDVTRFNKAFKFLKKD